MATPPSGLGVSRPGSTIATPTPVLTAQPPSSVGGVSRPANPLLSVAAPQSVADRAVTARMSGNALAQYEADRQRSKLPPQPVATEARNAPAFSQATRDYHSMDDYYAARQRGRQGWEQPPQVVMQQMSPNYGMWDVLFLSTLMSNINRPGYADWASAHRDDPDYRHWREDADRAANDNADMRHRLDEMDARMHTADPTSSQASAALPPGVEPAAAIAPEAMAINPFTSTTAETIPLMMQEPQQSMPVKESFGFRGVFKWVAIVVVVVIIVVVIAVFVLARVGRKS